MAENNMQALANGLSEQWQKERAETQMTLGELITVLEAMPSGTTVANLQSAHSYRGYYRDLAFERHGGLRLASELLDDCRKAMGEVFEGYKGGDFLMGKITPVWVAYYGCCGKKLMALHTGGEIEVADDEY